MTTRTRLATTIAAVAAFALLAPTTAHAATPTVPTKGIKVSLSQYPQLIDRPGTTHDVIRFTKVPNANWSITSADGTPTPVAFSGASTTTTVPVTTARTVTIAPVEATATATYVIAPGSPSAWAMATPTNGPAVTVAAVTTFVTWNDLPGDKDTVTLRRHDAIVWSVALPGKTAVEYDAERFGKKTELTFPAKSTITARAQDGYTVTTTTIGTPTVTADPTTTVKKTAIEAAATVGDNPYDATKGYGKGASVETVKIVGLNGVSWKIGGSTKPLKVKAGQTVYVPVDPDDIKDDKVEVTPSAERGYALAGDAPASLELDFADPDTVTPIRLTNAMVTKTDAPGAPYDTVRIAAERNVTWWMGQKDKKGKVKYTAMKPGRDGTILFKPRYDKDSFATSVFLKPIANRGYLINASGLTTELTFAVGTQPLTKASVFTTTTSSATLSAVPGVDAWSVKYSGKVGEKATNASATVKAADLTNRGIASVTFTGATATPTVTPKLTKGYALNAS
ncbi:hypothetical protein [Mobilicoccus sp.]|uniref:hypothetical protein n=1 Tax=Mobilicoccus sp. TaxID=2034349 RepID=UPI002897F3C5|nr:hypothetical protein [Mobilicoccus sp.]